MGTEYPRSRMADRRRTYRTRAAAPLLAGLLGLGIAACAPSSPATASPFQTITPGPVVTQLPSPSLAPTESATSAPTPSGIAAAPACTAADLKASHDLVEGAAGSRGTAVLLVAASRCSVDLYPAMGIRDANGRELVGSTAGGVGRIDLAPNGSYTSLVRFADWCNPDPAFPLTLVVRIGAEEVGVTGSSFPDEGDMPPCNGGGGPVLEAGAWEAAP
jgi:hypothetical protein